MSDLTCLYAAGLAAAYLGWASLALSQEKYSLAVAITAINRPVKVRWLGACLLLLSLVASWTTDGASFGTLLGVIQLSASAILLSLTLAWRPHWLQSWGRLLHRIA